MSLRLDPAEPADMEPEDRLDEIASILARAILRLHGRVRADMSRTLGKVRYKPRSTRGHEAIVDADIWQRGVPVREARVPTAT